MSSMTELRVKELLREKGWTTKILAEKTGMSESYLTHIKNGTRRWNEDSLRKLANAFEISPIDLFAQRRKRTDNIDSNVSMPEKSEVELKVQIIPVVGEIPTGTINGVNPTFTLANTPNMSYPLTVWLGGQHLFTTNGDFTIAGNTITFTGIIPPAGANLNVDYWH